MVINYVIGISSIAEAFTAKAYEASAPSAEVGSVSVPAPHTSTFAVSFTGLANVVHIIRLYGVTSGFMYEEYNAQPTENIVTIFSPIHFKVGDGNAGTPANGTNTYTNSSLIGLTINDFLVNKAGYGYYIPNVHYTFTPGTGTIGLTYPDQFSSDGGGDEFWIFRNPLTSVSNPVNDNAVGKMFAGFVDIVGAVSYIAGHLRKFIRLSSASTYTFTGSIPVGYGHYFNQMGASGTATINFSNAPLKWNGSTVATLTLTQGSTACFTFDGTNWNCVSYFNNSSTVAAYARITYTGSYLIGTPPHPQTDTFYPIIIPAQPDTNYFVLATLRGQSADPNTDNDVTFITFGKTINSFGIALRTLSNDMQNLVADFLIIRNN